ncbi:6-carboxytetrahydropterin synthase [Agaribacterium haliotis]|uniref:6-carboxytetrahydropterin synthase n=1 Tax=Agaribacterium haliotis TaxID=2013869 RepID=UPI000BB547E3|nr:6-carboxytetrahydropterin synthase [Agaribacterium haliotis]
MRLFVDQLTNLDFSYLDAKRGVIGETWLASIELRGELDEQGMICDFSTVKKLIRNWLDNTLDHKLLIPRHSSALSRLEDGEQQSFDWHCSRGLIHSSAPADAHALLPVTDITPDSVANWCLDELKPLFPSSVIELTLRFENEHIDGPYYHYSHGLQKHLGNCQRIAHGHRSRIDIWRNGEIAEDLKQAWAKRWCDIYIGTEAHCSQDPEHQDNLLFSYEAQQGHFLISLPKEHCYLISSDSTVELLAEHLAEQIKLAEPQAQIRVKAYEGLAKGAIVER